MTRYLRRAIPAYVVLLLVLAALGAANQHRLQRELALMDQRERDRLEIVELHARAAAVDGPLAVSRWAQERGMVPAPEVDRIEHVMPLAAPVPGRGESGVEVRTVWR